MTTELRIAKPWTHDPLGVSLLVATLIHLLALLGLSFNAGAPRPLEPRQTLDITIQQFIETPKPPEVADFLAPTSQIGGGEETKVERPTAPPTPPIAEPEPRAAPEAPRAGSPTPESEPQQVITASRAKTQEMPRPDKAPVKAEPRPDIANLLASTQQEIERLTAELDDRARLAAKKPRRKAINASTQEYKYAAYLDAWRQKVERIGNLNYPEEAKRRKIFGNLLLHVAVRADGSVERIRVVRSSGSQLLDDAARRIVQLSAPYAPFPPEVRKEVEVLDITRTWQFLDDARVSAE